MNPSSSPHSARPDSAPLLLKLIILGVVGVAAIFHLALAAKGYPHYRDQHLGPALNYAQEGIDLFRPVIVGFNANQNPTPLELPLWQAATGLLMQWFGVWPGWGNVVSLLAGLAGCWPLFRLARHHGSERVAWWTLLCYVTQPLVFLYWGHGGTDGFALMLALYFLYFADRLIQTGAGRWVLPAAGFGALAALTKAPFFFCAGLASAGWLLFRGRTAWRTWPWLALVGGFSVVCFWGWTKYTNAMLAQAEFPLVDLRTSGGTEDAFMRHWYFGDWEYRLNPKNWARGGWRFLNAMVGSMALSGLFLWGLAASKHRVSQGLFIAGAVTTMVFSHLVLHHWHYYLMFSPAVALLCGWAVGALERALGVGASSRRTHTFVVLMTTGLGLATVQGLMGMKFSLVLDPYPRQMAALLREHTTADEKFLIQGGGWGGELLIMSGRQGLSIWNTKFLEQPENLRRIQELGYTKLVMISESPMLTAIQKINPGQFDQKRETYEAQLTEVARPWPTLFESEDMLIKKIPTP